ncbi:MAG TPA: carbon-nitrogen hydrolase family protein [Solirubrobacteraceae bacterium]
MRAAAVQLNSTDDKARNRAEAEAAVRAAAADGADLVVLPEKWNCLGPAEVTLPAAEPLDGPSLTWARELARELEIDLVAGSIVEAFEDRERGANTSAHISSEGEIRALYRKIHLFDVEVDGHAFRESDGEEPGDTVVLTETSAGAVLGMSVCYDLRFPELYRALSAEGATVLLVPSAFTLPTTRDHWEVLVRARAIENQAFVVAPNQTGAHPGGFRTGGRSLIVDPWGLVLAQAPDAVGHVMADLDLDRVEQIRARMPALSHRRPELFA